MRKHKGRGEPSATIDEMICTLHFYCGTYEGHNFVYCPATQTGQPVVSNYNGAYLCEGCNVRVK